MKEKLIKLCLEIEKVMSISVEPTDPQQVQEHLANLIPYLSNLSFMISTATEIYDKAKGEIADEIFLYPNKYKDVKANVMSLFIQGKLANENSLFERVESLSKNLRSSVEGMRSIISFLKEEIRETKFTNSKL